MPSVKRKVQYLYLWDNIVTISLLILIDLKFSPSYFRQIRALQAIERPIKDGHDCVPHIP
jgi:hypothetical protein